MRHARLRAGLSVLLALPTGLLAQVMAHSTTPVLLVNGYQFSCPDNGVSGTFGQLPSLLMADGAAFVDFFDVCSGAGRSIEHLASLFTAKLGSYNQPVDVIAHSMGGLVVRSYLQGRTDGPFLQPPLPTKIRKLVFLGTPHLGVSNDFDLFPGMNMIQVDQMQFGSTFLWYLATWNQLHDDLRGVDSLALAGTAGITTKGVPWDGAVDVASASLDFVDRSRTRAVPYCHASFAQLLCGNSLNLADVTGPSHLSYQIIRSFLDGTNAWSTLAPAASTASGTGGIAFGLSDRNGSYYFPDQLSSVAISDPQNTGLLSDPISGSFVWFNNGITSAPDYTISFGLSGQNFHIANVSVRPGGFTIVASKFPPAISLVAPAAGLSSGSLSIASDSLISIYGSGLSASTAQASSYPWPFGLSDITLTIGGMPTRLTFARADQVNALVPAGLNPGLYSLVLKNSQGQHSINLMIESIIPTLFALANNAAAAIHVGSGQVVSTSQPAIGGEYVSLYATGLGPTTIQNGLSVATTTPSVFIDGIAARVTYAGRSPQYAGLDQINIQIPAGTRRQTSVPVVIVSGNRTSNSVSIAIN